MFFARGGGAVVSDSGALEGKHFDPKGKPPSSYTIELQRDVRATLLLADSREFEEVARGFISAPPYRQIMADAGNVAWDMASYDFLQQERDFASINPSLQRQAVLNMAYGLYEVVPGRIYQVRGFDLANISFIKGDSGWIVFDTLTAKETARAALEFINEKLGKRPVVAVVYSHSHGDDFGGVRGVVDEADVASGKVPIIAPVGFMDHAITENVLVGNAMTRRLHYQYGVLLPRSPFGHVDQAIGKNVAAGAVGLIAPTREIVRDIEEMTVDGVKMVFQNTSGTEAPAEMNTYFPQFRAFWAAENITGTIHNIYTLRGALIRDALEWSRQINRALHLFGQEAEGVSYKVNLLTPDNGEKYAIQLNNSALTTIRDFQIPNPDLTVTVNRSDIEKMLLGAASFEQLASTGKVRLEGNSGPLEQLKSMFVQFDIGFEILPGTMPAKAAAKPNKE